MRLFDPDYDPETQTRSNGVRQWFKAMRAHLDSGGRSDFYEIRNGKVAWRPHRPPPPAGRVPGCDDDA